MKTKTIAVSLLVILTIGFVAWFAPRSAAVARRVDVVEKKLRGELLGVSWLEVALEMLPAGLNLQRRIRPDPTHFSHGVEFPLEQDEDWKVYKLFHHPTACLDALTVHVSVLQAGKLPHALHAHDAEEVLLPISGDLEILRAKDGAGTNQTTERAGPGSLIFHAADGYHSLRAPGPGPSSYLVFKWSSSGQPKATSGTLRSGVFEYATAGADAESKNGSIRELLFEGPTGQIGKFHAHASTVEPGTGYAAHADDYDIGIFLWQGTVETIGEQITAPSVIFYSAHKKHGLRNPGDIPAKYVVFEFHGCGSSD